MTADGPLFCVPGPVPDMVSPGLRLASFGSTRSLCTA